MPFIVGSIRSGTTLLRLMLDAHPELTIPPESYFPRELWRRRARYERAAGVDLSAVAHDLLHEPSLHHFRDNWRLDEDFVRTQLSGVEPMAFADVLRRVYGLWAAHVGKRRYGDKTPVYVLAMDELASIFAEARFIHLIRDGRDVALSVRDLAHPDHPSTLARSARQWADWVSAGRASGARLGPDRYLEVRYGALVADPETVLRDIASFTALDFDDAMLRPQARGRAAVPEHERWQHAHLDQAPTEGLRDWRKDMDRHDLAVFEAVAGPQLTAAGYERAMVRLPLSARATALAITARTSARRAVARMKVRR